MSDYYQPISERQFDYIKSLCEKTGVTIPADLQLFSKEKASEKISQLLLAVRSAEKTKSVAQLTEEGMYQTSDGAIYRVQKSRQSGHLYAKRLKLEGGFEYVAGAIALIKPEDKMTLEQAKEFGVAHGVCCYCGRLLTDPESVALGIGPVCAGRM